MKPSTKLFDHINPRLLSIEPLERCCLDDCKAACCLHGVWIDEIQMKDILANAQLIAPSMPQDVQNPIDWFDDRRSADEFSFSGTVVHSTVLPAPEHYGETACVFLREWDHKCALQVAADENQLHPWRFKPFYCILHPLDLDEKGRITLEEDIDCLLEESGSCVRKSVHPTSLIQTFTPELAYFLGENRFRELEALMAAKTADAAKIAEK